jgi:hypothetical protein
MLLQKSKVPKIPVMTHYPGMSLKKEEFYGPEDLVCGKYINIFGRECLIVDCDEFTHQFYRERFGLTQNPINSEQKNARLIYNPVPTHYGVGSLGSEEDSMGSVRALQPPVPKKDEQKIFKQDMHILRF